MLMLGTSHNGDYEAPLRSSQGIDAFNVLQEKLSEKCIYLWHIDSLSSVLEHLISAIIFWRKRQE